MKTAPSEAPLWFTLLVMGVVLTILACGFGTAIWAVIRVVNHFT